MKTSLRTRRRLKLAGAIVCLLLVAAWAFSLPWYLSYVSDDKTLWLFLSAGYVGMFTADVGHRPEPICPDGLSWDENIGAWRQKDWIWRYGLPAPQIGSHGESWTLLPLWLPFLLIGLPTAFLLWRDLRRMPAGHCRQCGYNLTGNVSGVCPECGQTADEQAIIRRRGRRPIVGVLNTIVAVILLTILSTLIFLAALAYQRPRYIETNRFDPEWVFGLLSHGGVTFGRTSQGRLPDSIAVQFSNAANSQDAMQVMKYLQAQQQYEFVQMTLDSLEEGLEKEKSRKRREALAEHKAKIEARRREAAVILGDFLRYGSVLGFNYVDEELTQREFLLQIPLWAPILVVAAPLVWLVWLRRKKIRRWKMGQCFDCGYNLTDKVSARCPQCNAIIEDVETETEAQTS